MKGAIHPRLANLNLLKKVPSLMQFPFHESQSDPLIRINLSKHNQLLLLQKLGLNLFTTNNKIGASKVSILYFKGEARQRNF